MYIRLFEIDPWLTDSLFMFYFLISLSLLSLYFILDSFYCYVFKFISIFFCSDWSALFLSYCMCYCKQCLFLCLSKVWFRLWFGFSTSSIQNLSIPLPSWTIYSSSYSYIVIITACMFLFINSITCAISGSLSIGINFHLLMDCLFLCIQIIFYWIPTAVNFAFLGIGYFHIPINILDLVLKHSYFENIWFPRGLLLKSVRF